MNSTTLIGQVNNIIYVAANRMVANRIKKDGFTLVEMLLVLVIMSSIIYMLMGYVIQRSDEMRRDRTTMQMQQILNAAMAFYVNNSYWPIQVNGKTPGDCTGSMAPYIPLSYPTENLDLLTGKAGGPVYLSGYTKNPWGQDFDIGCDSVTGNFSVGTAVGTPKEGKVGDGTIIAGRLPSGVVGSIPGVKTEVVSTITIPGQNLNNARSVNYAGIYRSSACVPAPMCPNGMKPSIFVVPVGVTGMKSARDCTKSPCTVTANPIISFTAYARGKDLATPDPVPNVPNGGPLNCQIDPKDVKAGECNWSDPQRTQKLPVLNEPGNPLYWRVCLAIVTDKGVAYPSQAEGADEAYQHGMLLGSVLAITRCVPFDTTKGKPNESPVGSGFDIWTPNQSYAP